MHRPSTLIFLTVRQGIDVETGDWQQAAAYKAAYDVPLGDPFSLATADQTDATRLVGPDDDFDGIHDVTITQFRDKPFWRGHPDT